MTLADRKSNAEQPNKVRISHSGRATKEVSANYVAKVLQNLWSEYFHLQAPASTPTTTFTSFFSFSGEVFWQIRISCKGKFLRPVVISPSLPSDGGISTMLWDNITEGWTRKKSYKETSRKHIWPTKKRADSLSSVFLHPLNYTYSSKLGGGGKTPSSDPKYL